MTGARRANIVLPAMPAAAVTLALLAVTRLGTYTTPDSVFYVSVARSLAAGEGFVAPPGTQPLSGFPPLLPLVLAGFGVAGVDPLEAAGWINPLLLGGLVLLVGGVLARIYDSPKLGLIGATATAVQLDLLVHSAAALSEPLFLLLGFGGLVLLAGDLDRRRPGRLALATLLVAAACLTRYVGASLVLAGVVVLLRARRRRDAVLFAMGSLAPVALWVSAVNGVNRPLVWHGLVRRDLRIAAGGLSRWFLPVGAPRSLRFLVAVTVVVGATALALVVHRLGPPSAEGPTTRRSSLASHHARVLAAFAAAYLLVLVVYRLAADASARFDGRALLPLLVVALVTVVALLAELRWRRPRAGLLSSGLASILVVLLAIQAVGWVRGGLTDEGPARRGYLAAAWRRSSVLARVAALPPSTPVYSNAPDAIFLLTGRRTQALPPKIDHLTGRANSAFFSRIRAMESDLRAGDGVMVHFSAVTFRRRIMPAPGDLAALVELRPDGGDDVGTIYRLAPAERVG